MSQLSTEEVYQEIAQIVAGFPLLAYDECAKAVMKWLAANQIPGTILRLKTKRRGERFVTSDRYNPNQSITENGIHYGVEVLERVFDNLSTEGLPQEEWLQDFHCPSAEFTLEEIDSI